MYTFSVSFCPKFPFKVTILDYVKNICTIINVAYIILT